MLLFKHDLKTSKIISIKNKLIQRLTREIKLESIVKVFFGGKNDSERRNTQLYILAKKFINFAYFKSKKVVCDRHVKKYVKR